MSASPARLTTVKGLPRKPVRETEQTARPRADNRTGDWQRLAGFPWARRFPSCRPGWRAHPHGRDDRDAAPAALSSRKARTGEGPGPGSPAGRSRDRALRTGLAK